MQFNALLDVKKMRIYILWLENLSLRKIYLEGHSSAYCRNTLTGFTFKWQRYFGP